MLKKEVNADRGQIKGEYGRGQKREVIVEGMVKQRERERGGW